MYIYIHIYIFAVCAIVGWVHWGCTGLCCKCGGPRTPGNATPSPAKKHTQTQTQTQTHVGGRQRGLDTAELASDTPKTRKRIVTRTMLNTSKSRRWNNSIPRPTSNNDTVNTHNTITITTSYPKGPNFEDVPCQTLTFDFSNSKKCKMSHAKPSLLGQKLRMSHAKPPLWGQNLRMSHAKSPLSCFGYDRHSKNHNYKYIYIYIYIYTLSVA